MWPFGACTVPKNMALPGLPIHAMSVEKSPVIGHHWRIYMRMVQIVYVREIISELVRAAAAHPARAGLVGKLSSRRTFCSQHVLPAHPRSGICSRQSPFYDLSVRPQRNCNPAFDGPFTYARWTASYQSSFSSGAMFRCGRARAALHGRPADPLELMTGHLHLTGNFRL